MMIDVNVTNEIEEKITRAKVAENATDEKSEPPRPLARELPPADPFPIDALGDVLAPAARAINDRVQAPLAICGQSVLAAAALAVQGHADVELPTTHARPLTLFLMTVAATGERKTSTDTEALWPVRKREKALGEEHQAKIAEYVDAKTAWERSRKHATKSAKGDHARILTVLKIIGPAPVAPPVPMLTATEPTYEGLCKLFAIGRPSLGIFASEGGQFIGGHGMTDEAKLRTAAGLSALWDGEPIRRVRGGDDLTFLPGRRLAMHLMAQPDVAHSMLADPILLDQGLLSRVLASAPEPASGTRQWHEASAQSDIAIKRYGARLLDALERPLPFASDGRNGLDPRLLKLSAAARKAWIGFADHVEGLLNSGRELEPVRGLGNKLAEHAARIAGVLALVRNIEAGEVSADDLAAGIALAEHYSAEALRLVAAGQVDERLRLAQTVLRWLLTWPEAAVSLPDIYQRGPNAVRDKATAAAIMEILEEHGHVIRIAGGAEIAGTRRRDAWRVVRG